MVGSRTIYVMYRTIANQRTQFSIQFKGQYHIWSGKCLHKAHILKCYWLIFIYWTRIFQWCVVRFGSRNKHQRDTCLKKITLHLQKLSTTLHSIVNMFSLKEFYQHNQHVFTSFWHKLKIQSQESNQNTHVHLTNITLSLKVQCSFRFLLMFSIAGLQLPWCKFDQ